MRYVVWFLVVLMIVLHHDFWFWDDRTLVFGFMPIGLAYHAAYSIAVGVLWLLAVKFAWPSHIEEWADEFETTDSGDAADSERAH
ncbi:MAG: hypothetical protein GC159_02505 [Phycisphaera sp.]|nr:hypothetical protein [Phycisphaera sp.]